MLGHIKNNGKDGTTGVYIKGTGQKISKRQRIKNRKWHLQGESESRGDNSLAGKLIYTMYEVTVAAIHTVGLLCVIASSSVA